MDIRCRRCGKKIVSADVNVERMVAKCASCNAVFDFSDQLSKVEVQEPAIAQTLGRVRPPVPLPDGWELNKVDGTMVNAGFGYRAGVREPVAEWTLSWRWFSPIKHLFMLLFAGIWNVFLIFWYIGVSGADAPWFFYVFPLIHVTVGVSIGYGALAGLLNRTTLAVKDGVLTVRHGPLPWRGNHTINKNALKQLFCQQHVSTNKNNTTITYEVHAQLDGRELKLVRGLTVSRQALYIEQLIEGTLGIEDVPVAGELWMG